MPELFIGRKTSILIGKESTWGTKASSFVSVPVTEFNFNQQDEFVKDNSAVGVIDENSKSRIVKKWSEPNIGGILTDKLAGWLLLSALGSNSPSADDPEAGVNTHSLSRLNTNAHPSFTIIFKDDVHVKMCTGCRLNTLELLSEEGDFARFNATFVGKYPQTTTETPSYVEENDFLPKHRVVKLASNVAGLTGASGIDVRSVKINFEKNAEPYFGGSDNPTKIVNKQFNVNGDMTVAFENETYYDLVANNTQQAVLFELTNTDKTIGSSSNPSIAVTLTRATLESWVKEAGLDDIVVQTFGFQGEYDPSAGSQVTAQLINTQASY